MVKILSVDPGLTTGLALYDSGSGIEPYAEVTQIDVYELAFDAFSDMYRLYQPDYAICEDYISGGHLTAEAKITIKLVGAFEYAGGCTLVAPQQRLSAVSEATELLADIAPSMYRKGRDAISALAHAIAFARKLDR